MQIMWIRSEEEEGGGLIVKLNELQFQWGYVLEFEGKGDCIGLENLKEYVHEERREVGGE